MVDIYYTSQTYMALVKLQATTGKEYFPLEGYLCLVCSVTVPLAGLKLHQRHLADAENVVKDAIYKLLYSVHVFLFQPLQLVELGLWVRPLEPQRQLHKTHTGGAAIVCDNLLKFSYGIIQMITAVDILTKPLLTISRDIKKIKQF